MKGKILPLYFSVLFRWEVVIDNLTDREAGKLLKAMFHYRTKGENPNFAKNDRLNIFWCDVKDWLDTSDKKYKEKVKQASKAGLKSAEARNKVKGIDNHKNAVTIPDQKETDEVLTSIEFESAKSDTEDESKNMEEEQEIVEYFKDTFVCYNDKDIEVIKKLYWKYGKAKLKNGIHVGKKFGGKSANYVKTILDRAPNGELDMQALAKSYCKRQEGQLYTDFF